MRRLNYTKPNEIVGKEFKLNFSQGGDEVIKIPRGKIIGVVKDFHLSSMKKEIEPLVLFKRENLWLINFVVSYNPKCRRAIADMSKVWNSLFPEYPFQFKYVGNMYQQVYKSEFLQAKLLSIFTVIALFICSIGLFGLSLIITQHRTKELVCEK
ncbi:MAG: hypothetical protein IPF54_23400 [Draconibacterium sp.]|nr:hypothetical protein [Draconibacterium sp.]